MFEQAKHALEDAKQSGHRPTSNSVEDRHEYVKLAFQTSDGLQSALQSPLGSNPWIYDVSIVDHAGLILVSSDQNDGRHDCSGSSTASRKSIAAVFCIR